MAERIIDNQESWNKFVLENGGGFLQSWEWGLFQESVGRLVYRYRVDSSEHETLKETVGQFLIVQHQLPFGRTYLYVPMGPVVIGEGYRFEPFKACAVTIAQAAERLKATFARIEPPAIVGEQIEKNDLVEMGFEYAGQVQPQHTTIVDLSRTESELLAAMKQKTRYNIRIAEKHSVTIREADRSNAHNFVAEFDKFWSLMQETTERDQFQSHDRNYYEKMLDVLSTRKEADLSVRLMFAEVSGEPVAAALVAYFGNTATYLHGASTARHRSAMAPYLLHWFAIRQAKAAGLKKYDFWGVAPEDAPENHPWSGISRFKMGFGGARINYIGAWELPTKRLWYRLFWLLRRIKHRA
ncbi:MAG: peptidoglycan bridge formation glycyltransferase FemA/FemB family protein [Patescibacteria group bacterium]